MVLTDNCGLCRVTIMAVDEDFVAEVEQLIVSSDRLTLNLDNLPLPDEETTRHVLTRIATEVPCLKELWVSFPSDGTDDVFIAFLKQAQCLILEDGMSLLTRNQKFDLSDTDVGDESIKLLAAAAKAGHLTCLQELNLSDTEIGDESVTLVAEAALAGRLTSLQHIDLTLTEVGDKSMTLFGEAAKAGHLASLRNLKLCHTTVGDRGIKLLAEAAIAGRLTCLETINLSDTYIGDATAKLLAAAATAGGLPELYSLGLDCYHVGDESLKSLAAAARSGHLRQLIGLRVLGDRDRPNVSCVDPVVLRDQNAHQIFEAINDGDVLRETRILLLGQDGVGKTLLRRRLFHHILAPRNEKREETRDISLQESSWDAIFIAENRLRWRVQQSVWDFAGQLIAHGVHETFLTNDDRTVCVLVLDAKRVPGNYKERGMELGNRLEYWLRTIAHFAGEEVPVVIAITKCDDVDPQCRPIDQPLPQLLIPVAQAAPHDLTKAFKARVVAVVDDCSACDENRCSKPLRNAIQRAISQLRGIQDAKIPRKLFEVRTRIQGALRQYPLVSREQFAQWCASNGVRSTESQECDFYLRMLHHMGSLFYFGLTDGELRERAKEGRSWLRRFAPGRQRIMRKEPSHLLIDNVINTTWLKWIVYSLIERTEKNPWISHDEIAAHVAESDSRMRSITYFVSNTNSVPVVLEFLKLVDLSFYDENVGEYLFPRGLAAGPPPGTDTWERGQLHWDYVTEAAFHRFIVRMHNRGEVVCEEGIDGHWRDAVLIEHTKGNRAAILGKPDDGLVEIRFAPTSQIDGRVETWDYVKDLFVNELIGVEPIRELNPPIIPANIGNKSAFPLATVDNSVLATHMELGEQDAVRIERVTEFTRRVLGSSSADREFIRVFFHQTAHHEFGGETGRIAFRAAYFFWCFLRNALIQLNPKDRRPPLTWRKIFRDYLNGNQTEMRQIGWESFGNPDYKPLGFEGFRKSLEREKNEPLLYSLHRINPYGPVEIGGSHPEEI